MTLTKRDLVIRISNETAIPQQQVLEAVQKTLDYIADAVSKGKKVELRNFGVFEVKVRKARIGRNHISYPRRERAVELHIDRSRHVPGAKIGGLGFQTELENVAVTTSEPLVGSKVATCDPGWGAKPVTSV